MTLGCNSPLGRWLSFDIAETNGARIYSIAPNDDHVGNPLIKALHGGVVSTFLEFAALNELKRTMETEAAGEAININVDYLKSVKLSPLFAKAKITKAGRRLAFVDCVAWQQDEQIPVAKAACSFALAR